ncbi:MAG TPA: asparagine synthase (glutamine-hydrolyzing) [Micromonospora sp.]
MCGVAGVFGTISGEADVVPRMLSLLRHRGPDSQSVVYINSAGAWTRSRSGPSLAALGHCRLALVGDPVSGQQPAVGVANTVIGAVNGEIYNHAELRTALEADGYVGLGDCDCAVLPDLYAKYGREAFSRVNGVFSGALIDLRDMSLLLFRDQYGTRPLYYRRTPTGVAFASEIKALLAAGNWPVELDRRAAVEYLTVQSPLAGRTLFRGVHAVEPGCYLLFGPGGVELGRLPVGQTSQRSPDYHESVRQLRSILDRSVSRQWHSAAAAYLSSGVDTNAIVGTLVRHGQPVPTFTATFAYRALLPEDATCDESDRAMVLARSYGVRHHVVRLAPRDFQRQFAQMIWHLEDLRMPMSFGSWQVSRAAARAHHVMLSGTGGDELFGGYVRRGAALPADVDVGTWLNAYLALWGRRMLTDVERSTVLTGRLSAEADGANPVEHFRGVLNRRGLQDPSSSLRRLLAVEQDFFLPGLLHVEDRMSMAHGIETRVPLLDPEIVAFADDLPDDHLLRDGLGKAVLRDAIRDRVPGSTSRQPKQPFKVPESSWYRYELAAWVRATLLGRRTVLHEYVDRAFLRRVVEDHLGGVVRRRHLLWSLLCFEYWCRTFLMA